ncbi:MAG: hypothetical protein H7A36_02535 [Chlamydiales bacterium]|nr:hypothetical protein [Chlamydiales bacterium]
MNFDEFKGAAIDSRLVNEGDLFFALKGEKVDGHDFLGEVKKRGAAACVIDEHFRGSAFGLKSYRVPDVLECLRETAKKHLEWHPKRVIAITGTLGKTTTKAFTKTLLEKHFRVWASPKSYNSQRTVPLSILNAPSDCEILILEMGMSEPGNLKRLLEIAPPEVAVLTMVSVQHADNFPDGLAGILREKTSIFSHPKTRLGIYFEELGKIDVGSCEKLTFALEDREMPKQILHNFCAAKAVAKAFGVEDVGERISELKMPPMRFERVEKGEYVFINDAYNANPDSMKAALEALPTARGKKIAVLSEMDALGMYTKAGHAQVAEAALQHVDLLLCLGNNCATMKEIWKRENRPCFLCKTKGELREKLRSMIAPGDVILVKGARSHAMEEILEDY